MATNDTNIAHIIDFLSGRLSPEEVETIQEKIKDDEVFRKEVEHYEKLLKGMRQKKLEDSQARIASLKAKLPPIKQSDLIKFVEKEKQDNTVLPKEPNTEPGFLVSFLQQWWFRYAMPLVVVLAVGVIFINKNYSDEALAKKYYLEPGNPTQAGGSSAELMAEAYNAYFEKEDYEEAKRIFSKIPADDPYFLTARLFIAHTQFKLGDYEEAYQIFDQMITNSNYPGITDLNQLRWNRSMCQIALGQTTLEQELEQLPDQAQKPKLRKQSNSIFRRFAKIF